MVSASHAATLLAAQQQQQQQDDDAAEQAAAAAELGVQMQVDGAWDDEVLPQLDGTGDEGEEEQQPAEGTISSYSR